MKVCAIISAYNEEDIIGEALESLISQGVDVYLIDNQSTDNTLEAIKKFCGRGLVGVQTVKFSEAGKEVYSWKKILNLKERISRELTYDWYIHADADEIRYSPWPQLTLSEAIQKVNDDGYNLINFKLFDFRCCQLPGPDSEFEHNMVYYCSSAPYNQRQVKAWKRHTDINLHSTGGHHAKVPNPRVYPVRFVLKHYPLRNLTQARDKILNDRKKRFALAERRIGWHVQYDQYESAEDICNGLFFDASNLKLFKLFDEQVELLTEAVDILSKAGSDASQIEVSDKELATRFLNAHLANTDGDVNGVDLLTQVHDLFQACFSGDWKKIQRLVDICFDERARSLYSRIGRIMYLRGDPLLHQLMSNLCR
jgi:glycosyltransferase involved in cell wall biosynthesis